MHVADAAEVARIAGSDAHQGVCARVDPYPYADAAALLARAGGAAGVLVALDEVQDPQNVGAICRTAECAGAAGVVMGERRAPGITAAVAKASAGAVEHLHVARVRNLADFLATGQGGRLLVLRGGCLGGRDPLGPRLTGAAAWSLVLGAEGKGLRPRVAGVVRRARRAAAARQGVVAQRERRRGRAAVRDLASARRRLTSAP